MSSAKAATQFFAVIGWVLLAPRLTNGGSSAVVSTYTHSQPAVVLSALHETCCEVENLGKSFVENKDDTTLNIIMCPSVKPENCPIATSCLNISYNSTSDYYNITLYNGSEISVYCDMEGDNCDGEGGWTRIGYINTTQLDATCPPGWKLEQNNYLGYGVCLRTDENCNSVFYSTNGYRYSQVCGQVRGYTDHAHAFHSYNRYNSDIDSSYVDGISITRGNPRQHLWTYAAGDNHELFMSDKYVFDCPCNNDSTASVPPFVGEDYYCEGTLLFEFSDPLWDGEECDDIEHSCCDQLQQPWFIRSLDEDTNDDIEVRLCSSHNMSVQIDELELFVK